MNIDEILETDFQENNFQKDFNKEKWIKEKNGERNKVYSLIDKTSLKIVQDSEMFKGYLNIQSRFDKYSVANGLLIYAQMPSATQLREYSEWKAIPNLFFNDNKNSILLLKKDRKNTMQFVVYKMFDISQTNMPQKQTHSKVLDDRILLKAFIHENPTEIKVVDELTSGLFVELNDDDNILYIQRGADPREIYQGIVREISKVSFETDDPSIASFKAKCTSYIVCKKYGIDVTNYSFNDIPKEFKNLSSREIRKELEEVKDATEEFNSRINSSLESAFKHLKNKSYER